MRVKAFFVMAVAFFWSAPVFSQAPQQAPPVKAMELRACMNPNNIAACAENCALLGSVEFYLQPPKTVAVKVLPDRTDMQPTIYSLEHCVIIDQRNWSCSQNEGGVWARQEMVEGKYHTTVIIDGTMSLSHCAR